VKQCWNCIFRNNQNICEIKNIDIHEIDYDDCWFYQNTLEEIDKMEDDF
jgi:hypothetical protein